MNFARRVFTIAGIYGVIVLLPQYFMEPPGIIYPVYFYGFVGVALAWQFAFFVIARDPVRFRPLMWVAVVEKISFTIAAVILFAQARLTMQLLLAGIIDGVWGILFLVAMRLTPDRHAAA